MVKRLTSADILLGKVLCLTMAAFQTVKRFSSIMKPFTLLELCGLRSFVGSQSQPHTFMFVELPDSGAFGVSSVMSDIGPSTSLH
jgi:hypothetical protein